MLSVIGQGAAAATMATVKDITSYAEPAKFATSHLVLDLTANFDTHTIAGTVELHLERRDAEATELVLDTRALNIESAETATGTGTFEPTTFTLDAATTAFGAALRIAMPGSTDRVRITYTTSSTAEGLQWLTPAQTAGKTQPFMFTQAEAIQARSFIPLQDTPSIRATYDATIHTPKALVAVMAAEQQTRERGTGSYTFHMPQPIPSYLIAFAVGDLTFQAMGPRTGVWAEPVTVAAAAAEFSDTEKMIDATEALYGPYRWGRYDLLVLPPSFPFGGMENPRLTFATPTLIVGDKSLVSVVAHELAHSWSGNLVTNATWRDFWLNEGFTVYLEGRIIEAVYGKARADMDAMIGFNDLANARKEITVAGDRTLLPDLTGRNPDDAFSQVPYEQGALFLRWIESKVGRPAFDTFLRAWFDTHAFQSATTEQCLAFLHTHLLEAYPGLITDPQIQEWLHSEGVPSFTVLPRSDAFANVEGVRDAWMKTGDANAMAAASAAWTPQEWIHLIDTLPRDLTATRLLQLDEQFGLTTSRNAEIAHVWFRLAVGANYQPAYPALEEYLVRIGRRKLIVPIYRDLVATPAGKAMAVRIYDRARPGYHPLAQNTLDQLVRGK